jgi:subtilase family serine protease
VLAPTRRLLKVTGPAVTLAILLSAASAGAVTVPALPTPVSGVLSGRVALPGTVPTFVGGVPSLGPALPTMAARALIALRHRDQTGLLRFVSRVSDPRSSSYERYLTPAQFDSRYAPSETTVAAIESFARNYGLHVTRSHPTARTCT